MSLPRVFPPRYDLPWDAETGDVCCELTPAWDGGPASAVVCCRRYQWPQELWYHMAYGWHWGDQSPASQNYALAILDRFLAPAPGDVARREGRWLPCSPIAVLLTPAFCRDVVAGIPYWGGIVRGDAIRAWIAAEEAQWTCHGIDLAAEGPP